MNVGSVYVLVLDGDMILLVIIIFKIVCFIAAVNEVLSILSGLFTESLVLSFDLFGTCLHAVCTDASCCTAGCARLT